MYNIEALLNLVEVIEKEIDRLNLQGSIAYHVDVLKCALKAGRD